MKKICTILLALTISACGHSAKNAEFVPSLPDVPLMGGFQADPGTGSFFDSAEGRIVEMYATGFEDINSVKGFYDDVLPQFGWKEIDVMTYTKDGEIMLVTPEKQGMTTSVKYQLRPMSPAEKAGAV